MGKKRRKKGEQHKWRRAERAKLRKTKKKVGRKGKSQERKEKTQRTISAILGGSVLVGVIALIVWANAIGRFIPAEPEGNAFNIECYTNIWTFDVDPQAPFVETWREVHLSNRDVESYPTTTLEISRAYSGGREYFDVLRNVWADQIYMMEHGVLSPQGRTYNIISTRRGYWVQTIPCYSYDEIGIEVTMYEGNVPYTGTLKYHYTIAGTVSSINAAQSGTWYRISTGVSTIQETMAQDSQIIPKIFNAYGEAWTCRCTGYTRLG